MPNQEYENTKKSVYITTTIALVVVISVAIIVFLKTTETQNSNPSNTHSEMKLQELVIENSESNQFNRNEGSKLKIESDGYIHWYSAGSSTCPPVIEKAEYTSDKKIQLKGKTYNGTPCTMDLQPVHQIIKNFDGTPFADDVELELQSPDNLTEVSPADTKE